LMFGGVPHASCLVALTPSDLRHGEGQVESGDWY